MPISYIIILVIIALIFYGIYRLITGIVYFAKEHPVIFTSIIVGILYIIGIFVAREYGFLQTYFAITLKVLFVVFVIAVVIGVITAIVKIISKIKIKYNTTKIFKIITTLNDALYSLGPCYNYDSLCKAMYFAYGNKEYKTEHGVIDTNTLISYAIANYVKRNVNTISCYVEECFKSLCYIVDFGAFVQIVEDKFGNYCTGTITIYSICNNVINSLATKTSSDSTQKEIYVYKDMTEEQRNASVIINKKPPAIIIDEDDEIDDEIDSSEMNNIKTPAIILDDDNELSYDPDLLSLSFEQDSMYQDG